MNAALGPRAGRDMCNRSRCMPPGRPTGRAQQRHERSDATCTDDECRTASVVQLALRPRGGGGSDGLILEDHIGHRRRRASEQGKHACRVLLRVGGELPTERRDERLDHARFEDSDLVLRFGREGERPERILLRLYVTVAKERDERLDAIGHHDARHAARHGEPRARERCGEHDLPERCGRTLADGYGMRAQQ